MQGSFLAVLYFMLRVKGESHHHPLNGPCRYSHHSSHCPYPLLQAGQKLLSGSPLCSLPLQAHPLSPSGHCILPTGAAVPSASDQLSGALQVPGTTRWAAQPGIAWCCVLLPPQGSPGSTQSRGQGASLHRSSGVCQLGTCLQLRITLAAIRVLAQDLNYVFWRYESVHLLF